MFAKIFNRFRQAPLFALSVVLLAAILTGSLCGLQAANKSEQAQYDELVQNTPVKLVVTNLTGTRSTNLNAPNFVLKVFTNRDTDNSLVPYVKDVRILMDIAIQTRVLEDHTTSGGTLVGITGTDIVSELQTPASELVTWLDGHSSEDLTKRNMYCIVPKGWIPQDYDLSQPLTVHFSFSYTDYGPGGIPFTTTAERDLTVIGIHSGPEETAYAPFFTVRAVYTSLGQPLSLNRIEATLLDNSQMDAVRELSKVWFAEPNATGARTPWRYSYYFSYPYALRFDDDILVSAERTLRTSMLINEICAYLLFILSAGASFFVGFLMIRSRKREITLMRSVGTGSFRIFLEFALEQLICVLMGVLIGGVLFRWEPISRVLSFMAIYFVGLSVALVVFLRKNLLSTLKEDE